MVQSNKSLAVSKLSCNQKSHHWPYSGPEGAGAQPYISDYCGEHFSRVDVADSQRVYGGYATWKFKKYYYRYRKQSLPQRPTQSAQERKFEFVDSPRRLRATIGHSYAK